MNPSCKGCRFLVTFPLHPEKESMCSALESSRYEEFTAPDGKVVRRWVTTSESWIRPTVSERRASDGKCGPEARLREPGLRERFLKWLKTLLCR
jgi:hypothetical protein